MSLCRIQMPRDSTRYTGYQHKRTFGLLHRGQHMHGATPITDGERYNLIVWMRSSRQRNQLCPMCDREPELVESVGYGDGFTDDERGVISNQSRGTVDICTAL